MFFRYLFSVKIILAYLLFIYILLLIILLYDACPMVFVVFSIDFETILNGTNFLMVFV